MSAEPQSVKLNVFVSYSRDDIDFADQLVAALGAFGFAATLDRTGVHGAEDWRERLAELILESDTIVFVLTPASLASPVCAWEVEQAVARNKRIIPVLASPLGAAEPHEALRKLNYIYFYPEPDFPNAGFGTGVAQLTAALSVDIEWTREHTRLGALASRWQLEESSQDLLLRGSELARAKQWRDTRPPNGPELTPLHREFLQTSEDAETARTDAERQQIEERRRAVEEAEVAQRERTVALGKLSRWTRIGVIALSLLLIVLTLAGWFTYRQKRELEAQTKALTDASARLEEERRRSEGAVLRLREGMKLRIADTDHLVTTTERWYRIATDYKLAIGVYRAPYPHEATDIGSGFLVKGESLRPEWAGRVVFITASHVVRAGGTNDELNIARASISFPGIGGTTRMTIARVLFNSSELDVAVLELAGELPRHAVPVDLPQPAAQQEAQFGGVALLHWTMRDGFALGFGHGVARPGRLQGEYEGRMFYTHVTADGASGAPVFDASTGNVACLHTGSTARMDAGTARRPVGICTPMAKIVAAIAAN